VERIGDKDMEEKVYEAISIRYKTRMAFETIAKPVYDDNEFTIVGPDGKGTIRAWTFHHDRIPDRIKRQAVEQVVEIVMSLLE
jgi:hypothetical protein